MYNNELYTIIFDYNNGMAEIRKLDSRRRIVHLVKMEEITIISSETDDR